MNPNISELKLELNFCKAASIGVSGVSDTQLLISDNGSKIPEHKANIIMKEPVKSDSGLGIGLYQAARQAESAGYLLTLKSNHDGNVCFELTNTASESKQSNIIN